MARRAFIIAIEHYPTGQSGLSPLLAGTHEGAVAFRQWLVETQGVAPADIAFCAGDPALPGRTAGVTRTEIKMELDRFRTFAKDTTDDLYFYYSGHGLAYVDSDGVPYEDILVAADFANLGMSGDCCIKLGDLQKWLKNTLGSVDTAEGGPAAHYYFIDACRNTVTDGQIKVAPLSLPAQFSSKRKPPVFTLFSVPAGTVANVGSGFLEALVDGLAGKGHAKRWKSKTLAVFFESLREYVERRLASELDQEIDGSGDGMIRRLDPNLKQTCHVIVESGWKGETFSLAVKTEQGYALPGSPLTFSGARHTFAAPPDNYEVELRTSHGTPYDPPGPVPADLYDDCTLTFNQPPSSRGGGGPSSAPSAPSGGGSPSPSLVVRIPDAGGVLIRDGITGNVLNTDIGSGRRVLTLPHDLKPGRYFVDLFDRNRASAEGRPRTIARKEFTLRPGGATELDFVRTSPLREALLTAMPAARAGSAVQLSETLGGPTPDQGLDLWLAIIGASRIVGPDQFSKLGPLPLQRFDHDPEWGSVYVLAGFDRPDEHFSASVSTDWRMPAGTVPQHPQFPGLFEFVSRDPGPPGAPLYLTYQMAGRASATVPITRLRFRATLVTLFRDDINHVRLQQFVLPLGQYRPLLEHGGGIGIADWGDPELDGVSTPLRLVRRAVDVQRAFARNHDLRTVLSEHELGMLLYLKWFEPTVATMAAYELARRGRTDDLPKVVYNLRHHFHGLADAEALAKIAGMTYTEPDRAPQMLEGLQALDFMEHQPGLPSPSALDFRGPFTMWRGL